MSNDFEKMSLTELKSAAKSNGIAVSSTMRKADIQRLLLESQGDLAKPAEKAESTKLQKKSEKKPIKKEKPAVKETEKPIEPPAVKEEKPAFAKKTKKPIANKSKAMKQQKIANVSGQMQTQEPETAKTPAAAQEPENAKESAAAQEPENAKESAPIQEQETAKAPVPAQEPEITKSPVPTRPLEAENTAAPARQNNRPARNYQQELEHLDSGNIKEGILEIIPDGGYGFIRCDNFLPGENDVYVAPAQIRKFNLKTGDMICGNVKIRSQSEKFSALLYVRTVNGFPAADASRRKRFEDLTPIFPNERIRLETPNCGISMRMVDLISPIGKGQRGMIVSQPKAGKTTLLKQIARAITKNHPEMHLIILLIDERPEEVTDMKESIEGENVEVIYSTFDEMPDKHKRVSEMVIERAKRLVEHKKDVVILLDSITRLARAYNLTIASSGRTLSGGLDPAALYMPKKFFGAARNMREGGSLTILATALVETGSRMDDVVFEEFKGTGNMELVLDRNLSERRIFPAIDLPKSSTRRDDLLLKQSEVEANYLMRRALNSVRSDDAVERIITMFTQTKTNEECIDMIKRTRIL